MKWQVRLDDWQHGIGTGRYHLWRRVWNWAWQPLCNWVEVRHWRDVGEEVSYRPFGDIAFNFDAGTVTIPPSTAVTYGGSVSGLHTVYTLPSGSYVSCTVANCQICKRGQS